MKTTLYIYLDIVTKAENSLGDIYLPIVTKAENSLGNIYLHIVTKAENSLGVGKTTNLLRLPRAST